MGPPYLEGGAGAADPESFGGVIGDDNTDSAAGGGASLAERFYIMDADAIVEYNDGNFAMRAVAAVHLGKLGCDGVQMSGKVNLTLTKPALVASGEMAAYCPGSDGSRRYSLNVTCEKFRPMADAPFQLVNVELAIVASKAGGSAGWGAGLALSGTVSGTFELVPGREGPASNEGLIIIPGNALDVLTFGDGLS